MTPNSTSRTAAQLTSKKVLSWLASEQAVSWPVIVLIAIYPVAIGSIQVPDPSLTLPIDAHLYDLLGGGGAALVLALGRVLRGVRKSISARILSNLLLWLLAALSGTALQLFVALAFGPVPEVFTSNFAFGVLSLIGLMFSATAWTIIFQELKKSTNALAAKRFQLQNLKANLEDEVREQRVKLTDEVTNRLSAPMSHLIGQVEALAAKSKNAMGDASVSSAIVASQLREAIDQVIRPLSLEITSEIAAIRPTIQTLAQLRKSIRRLPLRERITRVVSLGYIFNVPLTGAMLAVFVLPSFAFILGSAGFVKAAIPATILSLASIWLLRMATQRLRSYYGLGLLESLLGAVITASPYFLVGSAVMPQADSGVLLYLTFEAFLINSLLSYASLFIETSYLNLRLAEQSNREIRKLVAYLQNEAQVNRRTMAQLVHGRIQARLQAASIKISMATEITDDLVAEIKADLAQAVLDSQETNYANRGVREQLAEMADQWSDICDLTFSLPSNLEQSIDASSVAKAAIVEVIREAINNAVKHSEADEADVTIVEGESGTALVVMRNAVHRQLAGPEELRASGYGSRMLDQITESWSVNFEGGDAILTATISLSQ